MMGVLRRAPGRHVTRRLTEPESWLLGQPEKSPTNVAHYLAEEHNRAVREYGSNSGGWHAYDPNLPASVGVFDGGPFPAGSVVSSLAWGRITSEFAQRLLEFDGAA
jgi:hypothetical protein